MSVSLTNLVMWMMLALWSMWLCGQSLRVLALAEEVRAEAARLRAEIEANTASVRALHEARPAPPDEP